MKSRYRVAIAILAAAAAPLLLVQWGIVNEQRAEMAHAADRVLTGNASESIAMLSTMRARKLGNVSTAAQLPGVVNLLSAKRPLDPVHVNRLFMALGSHDPVNIRCIAVIDLEGVIRQASQAASLGRDESGKPWFRGALANDEPRLT